MCLTLFKSFKMSFRKGKKSQMAFFDTVNAVNVWNIKKKSRSYKFLKKKKEKKEKKPLINYFPGDPHRLFCYPLHK